VDFEILIDDFFLKLDADSKLAPVKNKRVLSLINDYEDMEWRYQKFESFVWDNIALTALSAQERERLADCSHSKMIAAAKKLRLTDKPEDIGKGSELAEIVLYAIMHHHYKALSVVPKIFYKQNAQDNAKGADSVHIVIEGHGDFSLWFGEAKFFNSIEDARLSSVVKSVGNSLVTDKLKKENSIITSMADIDALVEDGDLVEKIKAALSNQVSIDQIKPKLHIPILLLHECEITSTAVELSDDYRNKIKDYHKDRANAYFKMQIESLADKVAKYSEIKFHIILFPVPDRERVINEFIDDVAHYKKKKG
jgi:hypothetical protein